MSDFEKRLRKILKSAGLKRRGSTAKRSARQVLKGLDYFEIDLILDVGANVGQFAQDMRDSGFAGRIVSFEPLSQAHAELRKAAARDPHWTVHPRCALGDFDGDLEIHVAGNSVSSSPLSMTAVHSDAAPGSAYVGVETAPVCRLDSIAAPYLSGSRKPLLKIDTQGYEWQVLLGAKETIPLVKGLICELSLVVLYEHQKLWREVLDYLEAAGFTLWGLQPGFMDGRDGRNLQVDAILFRA